MARDNSEKCWEADQVGEEREHGGGRGQEADQK